MSQYKIAPSILAADYANFEREIKRLEATGAEYAHIDIMDGHFVPQISFGAGVVEALRPHSKMVFDCHLMVANPEHHLEDFARAGADIISIHVEATPHIHGALQKIRSLGVKPSVVINPGTPIEAIKHVLHLVDQVLVMTVNPGLAVKPFCLKPWTRFVSWFPFVRKKAWTLRLKSMAVLMTRPLLKPKKLVQQFL